jgi:hypothetical protein
VQVREEDLQVCDCGLLKIEKLSEYITFLQNYSSSECVFRGENSKYEKRQASAFRMSGRFMQSINEYYSSIGHRLTDIERQNFLAFSQHHRLPTNLLDVTANPLYALFFACHEAKEKGYVYIFSNWFMLDITEIIEAFPRKCVFDLFISGNSTIINMLYEKVCEMFENKRSVLQFTETGARLPGNEFVANLFCAAYCYARDIHSKKNGTIIDGITLEDLRKNVCGDGIVRTNELFLQGYSRPVDVERERFNKLLHAILADDLMSDINLKPIDDFMYYIVFMLYCFRTMRKLGMDVVSNNFTELFPIMLYKPKITFERARLQQGYFIYTPYIAASGVFSDLEIKMKNILPSEIIEVDNPYQILLELENIGVNVGTVFGDYDSVAKHINEKENRKHASSVQNG